MNHVIHLPPTREEAAGLMNVGMADVCAGGGATPGTGTVATSTPGPPPAHELVDDPQRRHRQVNRPMVVRAETPLDLLDKGAVTGTIV